METHPLAIVTGAGHRLGRSIALSLAHFGYDILLHYNSSIEKAEDTKLKIESLGGTGILIQSDLSKHEGIRGLLKSIDKILESSTFHLEVLVNSASIMKKAKNITTYENWDSTYALNLRAPYILSIEIAKRIKKNGLIVNISDVGARKLWKQYPEYVISKSGLETMTRLLAKSLAPRIRVNAIAPGLVLQSRNLPNSTWEKILKKLPLQRTTTLEEIESTLLFLINNQAVTGQIIDVDCGFSLVD